MTKQDAPKKMDAEDGSSLNVVAENVEKLRELFPDAFTEGSDDRGPRWKLDLEVLREVVGEYSEESSERYSFTWHGKSRARRIAQTPSTGTLRPCPEESMNWDATRNLFIEGDNLEVLKLLQKSYHRRVKMIYIDPPYNTGKEFIYPDKFQDNLDTYLRYTGQIDDAGFKVSVNAETSGRFHTNWLNMMYPRLRLARNLLRDDGVVFVSCDDHEQHNLKLLLNEVFGEENAVATIIWEKADSPRNSAVQFSEDHDYVLVYSRHASWRPHRLPRTAESDSIYSNPDDDSRGPWLPGDPYANHAYSKGTYTFTGPTGREFSPPPGRYWRVSEQKLRELDADGRIWWGPNKDARPSIKRYLSEVSDLVPRTLWKKDDVGSNRTSKNEIRALFPGDESFDTPKPVALIERMLRIATDSDASDVVLDFFAGSGSTAHAVMKLNHEDGGNRRFVLVQLPEPIEESELPTIAALARERLRRSAKQIQGEASASKADVGFRAFVLDSSNIVAWDPDFENPKEALFAAGKSVKDGRGERDILSELLLKFGLDLSVTIESRSIDGIEVFVIGAGALVVCLSEAIDQGVVEGIAALRSELSPEVMRVVLKDSGFADDVVKTNAVQTLRQAGIEDVKSL